MKTPKTTKAKPRNRASKLVSVRVHPAEKDWPKAGWKHTLEEWRWRNGDVFGWNEDGRMWSGIVEETATCSVKVRDVLPGVFKS